MPAPSPFGNREASFRMDLAKLEALPLENGSIELMK